MKYESVCSAVFLERPNRFVARVRLDGAEETVHVKNTGRCRELLIPGRTVYLSKGSNPGRKTAYDLIAVDKDGLLVNLDAQAPNQVFAEWARAGRFVPGLTLLRPETVFGASRLDFYWEAEGGRKGFVEVKGCTLEDGGWARFPDAPTQRGVKHLGELVACRAQGLEAAVCFVIQMEGMRLFSPNDATHPAFGDALRAAQAAGVEVLAVGCAVTPDSLTMDRPVAVDLQVKSQ
jgi:sugar fermentation stimulation protein A